MVVRACNGSSRHRLKAQASVGEGEGGALLAKPLGAARGLEVLQALPEADGALGEASCRHPMTIGPAGGGEGALGKASWRRQLSEYL